MFFRDVLTPVCASLLDFTISALQVCGLILFVLQHWSCTTMPIQLQAKKPLSTCCSLVLKTGSDMSRQQWLWESSIGDGINWNINGMILGRNWGTAANALNSDSALPQCWAIVRSGEFFFMISVPVFKCSSQGRSTIQMLNSNVFNNFLSRPKLIGDVRYLPLQAVRVTDEVRI